MKLYFYGSDQCVTGSCHCLEVNGKRILVDCGLQQGRDEIDNAELPFDPSTIDYVLVTHAHIDHTGRIPLLVRQGFTGQIWTTRLTARLMEIMLIDSAYIQQSDASTPTGSTCARACPRWSLFTPSRMPSGFRATFIPGATGCPSSCARV